MTEILSGLATEALRLAASDESASLEKALLCLLGLVHRRDTYTNPKVNPRHAMSELAHEILLSFAPMKRFHGIRVPLTPGMSCAIEKDVKGKYFVALKGDKIPPDIEEVPPYKYDVCISFAGEDREVAAAIAEELRSQQRRVFYDDYEASNLWGPHDSPHFYLSRSCADSPRLPTRSGNFVG